MSLHKTEAIILKAHNWSESSRTVEMFSRDFGRIALADKGGRRLTSKRGRLVPFARTDITFYKSEKSERGYVSEAELLEAYSFEQEGAVGRLAYASAACELVRYLLSDEEAHPDLYDDLLALFRAVERLPKQALPGLFLAFYLHLLAQLGYYPSLEDCVGCGKLLAVSAGERDRLMFSPERGGILCGACQTPGEHYIPLSYSDVHHLVRLQRATLKEAATVSIGYQKATRLLDTLTAFARFQTGAFTELKSLGFLSRLGNNRRTDVKGND